MSWCLTAKGQMEKAPEHSYMQTAGAQNKNK